MFRPWIAGETRALVARTMKVGLSVPVIKTGRQVIQACPFP